MCKGNGRLRLTLVTLTIGLLGLPFAGWSAGGQAGEPIAGGTFRIAGLVSPQGVDSIDPALAGGPLEEMLTRATCAQLMALPGPKPEVAAGYPKVSPDRLTYTFTIRKGFRFNTGEAVSARSFATALTRALNPSMRLDVEWMADLFVGGRDFFAGKAATLRGVVATRQTLVLKLTKPWPDLLEEIARPGFFCPVPAGLPPDPEGVGAPLPGAGPYYFASFVPGRQVVLARNRLYRGRRPQHVDRFVVDLTRTLDTSGQLVVEGKADYAPRVPPWQYEELAKRYGLNRSRFFVFPGESLRTLVLNTERPLFRKNAMLRRAMGFAIDRSAMLATVGKYAGTPTDQFLDHNTEGFRDARIYPNRGNLGTARSLARGRTRSRKAALYITSFPAPQRAQAELVQARLRELGIESEIHVFSQPVMLAKLATPGEPYDIAWIGWTAPRPPLLNWIFAGDRIPPAEGGNFSHFNSPRYNRLLGQAERLTGSPRARLYRQLDLELARDAVPVIPLYSTNFGALVSARAGCHRFDRQLFDLATLCLTRR